MAPDRAQSGPVDSACLALSFNPELLVRDLSNLDGMDWTDHFVEQNYDGSWSAIPLRGPAGETHPIRQIYSDPTCTEFEDTPFLDACPYIREVLAHFECTVNAVRLMKLTPGSVIREHTDHDLALEDGSARLHIPITTNPQVEFVLNGKRVVMQPGECWYLRFSEPHSVANRGDDDRVHLVIDVTANEWLDSRVRDS